MWQHEALTFQRSPPSSSMMLLARLPSKPSQYAQLLLVPNIPDKFQCLLHNEPCLQKCTAAQ